MYSRYGSTGTAEQPQSGMTKYAASAPSVTEDSAPATRSAGLVVDVQLGCLGGMTEEGAKKYLEDIAQAVEDLRRNNIPVIWVTMSDRNELSLPEKTTNGQTAPQRSDDDLHRLDFHSRERDKDHPHRQVFLEFLKNHGPRTDEAVYQKAFWDTFTDEKDTNDPKIRKHLEAQRKESLFENGTDIFKGQGIAAYLKEQGIGKLAVMGMMSTVCVLESAMGAVRNGFQAEIMTDLVAGRGDPARDKTADWHKADLQDTLQKIIGNPAALQDHPTKFALSDRNAFSAADKNRFQSIGLNSFTGFKAAEIPAAHKNTHKTAARHSR